MDQTKEKSKESTDVTRQVENLALKIGDETVRALESQKLSVKNRIKLVILKWQIYRFRRKVNRWPN
ncbi:MAG: hypothetical protein IJM99_10115 [Firmicutes bacterium]|nr:hypothetical protein [Bacillota bacterium]